jgi:hypothetical protein
MNECSTTLTCHFTKASSLAALGVKLQQLNLFEPIRHHVHIAQKTVKYKPIDKLYDGFMARLSGAHGLVEINTLLRADPARPLAFGREQCAEQSVVQQTLDHCTSETVGQMEQAMDELYRQHSRGYRHDYAADWQVLDVDLSGWLCGKGAALATKGYFATTQRNRHGRQLGRVRASRYKEVVVDRLFPGNRQLNVTLQELMAAAQSTLELTEARAENAAQVAHRCRWGECAQSQLALGARLPHSGQSLFKSAGPPIGQDRPGVDQRSARARAAGWLGEPSRY